MYNGARLYRIQSTGENMETKFHGNGIVEILDDNNILKDIDDVFGLLFANNCSSVILKKENMGDNFFDLSTGIAGDILQKFSTYRIRLAIIGEPVPKLG
jgi:hypothetical protein